MMNLKGEHANTWIIGMVTCGIPKNIIMRKKSSELVKNGLKYLDIKSLVKIKNATFYIRSYSDYI